MGIIYRLIYLILLAQWVQSLPAVIIIEDVTPVPMIPEDIPLSQKEKFFDNVDKKRQNRIEKDYLEKKKIRDEREKQKIKALINMPRPLYLLTDLHGFIPSHRPFSSSSRITFDPGVHFSLQFRPSKMNPENQNNLWFHFRLLNLDAKGQDDQQIGRMSRFIIGFGAGLGHITSHQDLQNNQLLSRYYGLWSGGFGGSLTEALVENKDLSSEILKTSSNVTPNLWSDIKIGMIIQGNTGFGMTFGLSLDSYAMYYWGGLHVGLWI